jgi:hypothetical protein
MPRSEELKALDEAITRDNARRGWRSVKPTPRPTRGYSFVDDEKTAPTAGDKTNHSSEWDHAVSVILEAEAAAAAERGRQAIAQLLLELNTKD